MSFNFEIPVINLNSVKGEEIEKYRMNRAIEILSRSASNYVMGINDVETTNSTMANLLNKSDFPQKYNDSLEILKLAYYIYQRGGYEVINTFLRENNGLIRGKSEFGEEDEVKYSVEDIIDALDYLIEVQPALEDDIILYRAVSGRIGVSEEKYSGDELFMYGHGTKRASFVNGEISEFSSLDSESFDEIDELIGKTYKNEGYTSTTFKSNFTGHAFKDAGMTISIRVPKGTKVLGPFYNFRESEILLGRGYEFKIVGMEYIEGKLMVYTELQPRELEKSPRLPEDIAMPELICEKGFPDCNIHGFSEPQQEIVEDVQRRKALYQIHSTLDNILEGIDKDYSNIRLKYQDLQLDLDDSGSIIIHNHIMNILNAVDENNLSLEQLEETLSTLLNSREAMQGSLENLSAELEAQFCETVGTQIQGLIRDNDIEDLEQKIKDIQSKKVTVIERIFGKDKLHNVMIENLKKQIKDRKQKPVKKYTNMVDIFKDVLSYIKENGMPEKLKIFLSKYNSENATEEENLLFEQIISQQTMKEKTEIYQPIPLFSIRKSTKKLQEELNGHNSEISQQNPFQIALPSEQAKIAHSLEKCFVEITRNVGELSKNCEDNDINVSKFYDK